MGLVQQERVGQSRGKMPLPRLPIETWKRLLWEAPVGAASRRDSISIAPRWRSHGCHFKANPLFETASCGSPISPA